MLWLVLLVVVDTSTVISNQVLDEPILVKAKVIGVNPIFHSNYRYDNNERNTSAAYDLWDQAGYSLFEWPGNITQMDPDFPLLKWGKARSKYVQSPCEIERGLELATYSHKYLHLTWGSNHLRKSYCHPLRVDRKYLPDSDRKRKTFEITVVDFDFVFDALLVVTEQGYIIRVGEIELTHQKKQGSRKRLLNFKIAKGLTQPINKIITQQCCSKTPGSCPNGDTVIGYREASESFTVFISYDGGHNFKELKVAVSRNPSSSILHALVYYPNWKRMYILHGSNSKVYVDELSLSNGTFGTVKKEQKTWIPIKGFLQARKIGMEMSFLIWDNCSVWYAKTSDSGLVLIRAVFYVHNSILLDTGEVNKTTKFVSHTIRPTHCYLGRDSALSVGEEGKIGLLDQNNVFLYGIDMKSKDFALVALSTDLSLLLAEKKNTIYPCFDRNNRPKLLYPPRYLHLSHKGLMDENYKRRLAMRIVKKTLFPSDFMSPFFEEHLKKHLPGKYKYLAVSKCMTSSLSVDGSVTQKAKMIKLNFDFPSATTITFYAYSSLSQQLNFEPKDLQSFLNIDLSQLASVPVGGDRHWVKYSVNITLRRNYLEYFRDQDVFLLNLFTTKSLRCIHQPQFPVWIKIDLSYNRRKLSKKIITSDDNISETKIRLPATLLSWTGATDKINHCPVQEEFDRQASTVCSQSSMY